jgi:hypothetical protein
MPQVQSNLPMQLYKLDRERTGYDPISCQVIIVVLQNFTRQQSFVFNKFCNSQVIIQQNTTINLCIFMNTHLQWYWPQKTTENENNP